MTGFQNTAWFLMVRSLTKRGWRNHIASLIRQADAGEVSAMTDLGLNLLEGIQDRKGRSMVRRNPRLAVTWLRRAANRGDSTAASSLGYAYDLGLGTKRNVAQANRWYRRAARSGNSTAMSNLATVYRDAGKAGLAFQWWKRASDMRYGDAAVDVGYCYQYGLGTRKNAANAKRMFRRAIASNEISQYGREEAMYHLAVQFIDNGDRRLAFPLLKEAIADDDFPEAASVLNQLKSESAFVPCRCKRFINKRLRGHTKCSVHAG
jgi:TPR repeat protein